MKNTRPFTILAVGQFSFRNREYEDIIRDFPGTIDEAMPAADISLSIPVEKRICEKGSLKLSFTGPADFSLQAIVNNHSRLRNLQSAADYIASAMTEGQSAAAIHQRLTSWEDLPFRFAPPETASGASSTKSNSSQLDDILDMVELPTREIDAAGAGPIAWKNAITALLEQNLTAIFSHSDFHKTTSAWHGLGLLTKTCAGSGGLFLQTLSTANETLDELSDILRQELSRETPHLILIDFAFDNTPRSLRIIEALASLCEEFLVPAAISLKEQFLHLDSWEEIDKLPYLPHYLEEVRFAGWKRFRTTSGAGWIAATCNPFQIIQAQSGMERTPFRGLPPPPSLSPVWGMGSLCAQSVRGCGWPTRFMDEGHFRIKDGTVSFNLSREKAGGFAQAGFLPLSANSGDKTVFCQNDATVAGTSFAYQLLVARSVAFFLELNSQLDKNLPLQAAESQIRKSWRAFWEQSEAGQPPDNEITLQPDNAGNILLSVSFRPPETVLPRGASVAFTLSW